MLKPLFGLKKGLDKGGINAYFCVPFSIVGKICPVQFEHLHSWFT